MLSEVRIHLTLLLIQVLDMVDNIEYLSAADQVVEFVKNGIRKGRFKLGDKLPSEAELGDEIGVGRSSLREGMNILRAFGLVDIRRGDGHYIDNKTEQNFMDVLGLQVGSTTADLLVLRKVLETGTVGLICPKISDEEIEYLQMLTNKFVPGTPVEECVDADREFHMTIAKVLGNPLVTSLTHMIFQSRMNSLLIVHRDLTVLSDTKVAHQAIVNALRAHDPEAATHAMTLHMNHTIGHMVAFNML